MFNKILWLTYRLFGLYFSGGDESYSNSTSTIWISEIERSGH